MYVYMYLCTYIRTYNALWLRNYKLLPVPTRLLAPWHTRERKSGADCPLGHFCGPFHAPTAPELHFQATGRDCSSCFARVPTSSPTPWAVAPGFHKTTRPRCPLSALPEASAFLPIFRLCSSSRISRQEPRLPLGEVPNSIFCHRLLSDSPNPRPQQQPRYRVRSIKRLGCFQQRSPPRAPWLLFLLPQTSTAPGHPPRRGPLPKGRITPAGPTATYRPTVLVFGCVAAQTKSHAVLLPSGVAVIAINILPPQILIIRDLASGVNLRFIAKLDAVAACHSPGSIGDSPVACPLTAVFPRLLPSSVVFALCLTTTVATTARSLSNSFQTKTNRTSDCDGIRAENRPPQK